MQRDIYSTNKQGDVAFLIILLSAPDPFGGGFILLIWPHLTLVSGCRNYTFIKPKRFQMAHKINSFERFWRKLNKR